MSTENTQFADFLSAHDLTPEQVVAESKAAERLSAADREAYVQRQDARREKKTYADVGANKPEGLRRGVAMRTVKLALDGNPITRTNRKKITRAVERLLKNEVEVTVLKLFADVKSRNHKEDKAED